MDQIIHLLANGEEVIDVDEGTPPPHKSQKYYAHLTRYRIISSLRTRHPKQQPRDAQSPSTISRDHYQ